MNALTDPFPGAIDYIFIIIVIVIGAMGVAPWFLNFRPIPF